MIKYILVVNMNYIKGNFRKYIYKSDNGFAVGIFKVKETNDEVMQDYVNKTITFSGNFLELNMDDLYVFYGEGVKHPRYGFQYSVNSYDRVKPEEKDGIIEFLCSDLFNGIGEKTAKKIVDVLGDNTLDLIIENKDNLLLVPNLKQKKIDEIYNTLMNYNESHNTIVYLTNLGFSMKDSLNIYNKYKSNTIQNIEYNIYMLLDDIDNVNFERLDEIAKNLNYDINDERRIEASIIYIMKKLIFEKGDTYLIKEDIINNTLKYLKLDIDIEINLINLNKSGKIIIEQDKYYLTEIYHSEKNVANTLYYLANKDYSKKNDIDDYIDRLENLNNITYNEQQKEAIKKAIEKNLLIITGGPGTGKTTIIKAIVEIYKEINKYTHEELTERIALLAPTGRAAKRISESTMLPASTIHRFLKWNKDSNEFSVNEYNKDYSEFVIIDEVSMIDISLFDSLLKGLTRNVKIILVGDYNQLPSVGPGQVLKDLIESDVIDTVHLDLLYRQNENSYIVNLAHEIKNNDLSLEFLNKKDDYAFIECASPTLKYNVLEIVKKAQNKGYTYKDIQILAPMYKGVNGIDNLNVELQEIFNPPSIEKKEITFGDVIYREQDKILQLTNMPDDNVFNGDIGIISMIKTSHETKTKKNEIYVDFDGNVVKYEPKDFINIKHGYAISIHKSQGSEFKMVVMPMDTSYRRMLYRKLIYTGITRAKQSLILVGNSQAFSFAVSNDNEYNRLTTLKEFLLNNIN
ncbi:MAG: ATP-dependent RecD-like DNA helicase [Firmicutes bacterium]|nr:ATP-dependent RecD-like DNA helicase [Bacillota bacterium]